MEHAVPRQELGHLPPLDAHGHAHLADDDPRRLPAVHEVGEDDELAHEAGPLRPHRQTLQVTLLFPEPDVVLEREEREPRVQDAHAEGQREVAPILAREHLLQLVQIRFRHPKVILHHVHGVHHLRHHAEQPDVQRADVDRHCRVSTSRVRVHHRVLSPRNRKLVDGD